MDRTIRHDKSRRFRAVGASEEIPPSAARPTIICIPGGGQGAREECIDAKVARLTIRWVGGKAGWGRFARSASLYELVSVSATALLAPNRRIYVSRFRAFITRLN